MLDFEEDEFVRPEFKGVNRISPITNKTELYYSPQTRKLKYVVIFGFTILKMCATAGASVGLTYEKLFRGIALGAVIFMLSAIFKKFGHKLSEWENHKYDSDFENSLVEKKIAVKMAKRKRKQFKREGNIVEKLQRVEKGAKFAPYDSTVEDYLEMFIQMGFATFLVMAYPCGPLAPLLAFVNN
ncbi:ngep-related [Anaeramoeba flamelloides]|uniref:Ngep-related n=1 Tax=Anaeramoeba flamelloides TaxID=1746091 RepID=A0AAV7YAL0_9EUKA|nr:ngep-related [Anaeramoeba flamelloides]